MMVYYTFDSQALYTPNTAAVPPSDARVSQARVTTSVVVPKVLHEQAAIGDVASIAVVAVVVSMFCFLGR